jgi:hypothetical protein
MAKPTSQPPAKPAMSGAGASAPSASAPAPLRVPVPAVPARPPPPTADELVAAAQRALQAFWASPGTAIGAAAAADACRAVPSDRALRLIGAWIPHGNPGSSTAVKCDLAREIVAAVIAERGEALVR